ncbi:hypothetical protein [Synechococcus sp. GFB01]|uniref:hypothetical protein n=1 Tax=Synechococcus sp. GFB01 TaxID=1662190 RepID=UPI00128C83E4|nr:hypothetical protein [Synechococcus sp. GFB01]
MTPPIGDEVEAITVMPNWQPPNLHRVIRGVVLGTPLTFLLVLLWEGGLTRSLLLVPTFGSMIPSTAPRTAEPSALRQP